MDAVARIARTVLYEGYLLWPYRRSAMKNRQRWTFGGIYPPGFVRDARAGDGASVRTECLVEAGADLRLDVTVRFLHVVARRVLRLDGGRAEPVDELVAGGERHLAWDEATEREVRVRGRDRRQLLGGIERAIDVPAGDAEEAVADAGGVVGLIARSWEEIRGSVHVAATPVAADVLRVSVEVANTTPFDGTDRGAAVRCALVSTHTVLHVRGGAFVSQTDPPDALRAAAAACRNEGAWPVLVGEPGARDTMLAAPIILSDWPAVAPESPGDLFDGGEIDQLLVLNVLGLTDAEKEEMAASDPRAREILRRCEALSPDARARLHGTIRSLRPAP